MSSVTVDMGKVEFSAAKIPCTLKTEEVFDEPFKADGKTYDITCLSAGNPHCVIFTDDIDGINLAKLGPKFENAAIFPEKINTEFVRVVGKNDLRVRVWERGNGETLACGTGAIAAAVAAVKHGFSETCKGITVRLAGGILTVNYDGEKAYLTGPVTEVFTGEFEY